MMSPDNLAANPPSANKEETHQGSGSNSRKTASTNTRQAETVQALNCPRCDSPNTKFCYYNNYSLTQPRHFCKTCRRYWTKGGALRNVPIGGGCRKNKKITSKSSSSRLSSGDSKDSAGSSYSDIGGFKFFNSLSPAMDFQLGGLNNNFPRFQSSTTTCVNNHHQLPTSFEDISTPVASINSCFGLDPSGNYSSHLMGFNFPLSSSYGLKQDHGNGSGFNGGVIQEMGSTSNNNLASSIESLSSINQDLHWKLQQQRLAMLFGGGDDNKQKELENQAQRPQPILFENLEISSKPDDSHHGVAAGGNSRKDNNGSGIGNLATEWYFDKYSSYAPAVNPTPTNSSSAGNNGIQAWSNFDQYTALP